MTYGLENRCYYPTELRARGIIMYKCKDCDVSLNEDNAYRRYDYPKRFNSYCKSCLHNRQMRRWKQRKVDMIKYKGGTCEDCKGTFPPEVYQFHHLNPEEKEFEWNKARLLSKDKMMNEVDKCALLCANCHILRHSKDIDSYL